MKPTFIFLVLLIAISLPSTSHAQLDLDLDETTVIDDAAPNPWTGSFAAGLNGKTGNSQNLDINMALNSARETETGNTTLFATYFYSTNQTATVTDRLFAQGRRERKLANPKWSIFLQSAVEWDRFKAFDYRIAIHGGLAYEVYKKDDGFLNVRLGSGASREVGGVNDQWSPELQLGADWQRQVTETMKLYVTSDYYPNVEDFSDFRLNTNAGLEFVVDADRNINFRMFTFNRYDSTPEPGNVSNDVDYGIALVLGF